MGNMFGATAKSEDKGLVMLSSLKPPNVQNKSSIADGRLGFVIVFDCHDKRQLQEAFGIHRALEDARKADNVSREAVVFLLASQLDKDIHSVDAMQNRREAQVYVEDLRKGSAKLTNIYYDEVSAMEHRKVKRVFRRLLASIRELEDAHQQSKKAKDNIGGHVFAAMGNLGSLTGPPLTPLSPTDPAAKKYCALQ